MLENSRKQTFSNTEYHDGCGIGFIVETTGKPSRRVIDLSIKALKKALGSNFSIDRIDAAYISSKVRKFTKYTRDEIESCSKKRKKYVNR